MENVPPFIAITTILILAFTFLAFVLGLFGWLKVEPSDVKKFLVIRGQTLAWNAYLIIAILSTFYLLLVLSIIFSTLSFSFSLATLIVLILWALLGMWTPAIQRLRNKRINTTVNIVYFCLLPLMVVGFWIVKWPEIQQPIFVTLLLLAIVVIYIVDRAVKKRRLCHNED